MGEGLWEELDKYGKWCAVCTVVTAVIFVLLTIPYWISISELDDDDPDKAAKITLTVISAVILLVLAAFGCFGAFRSNIFCLKQYGCMSIAMWIFTMVLVILQYVALSTCTEKEPLLSGTLFEGVCTTENDYLFWVPSLIVLFLTSCAAFASCGMCWKLNRFKPSSGGGFGEYFG
eukprot:TRINITY_DN149_c0_g4_i1.p1 TRINITY_DN149_c0_g4~~TRINITY_DN149_c0_g4_i1.p1  ORF type:complete len:183 (+),score=22.95 TRINITY_DN149_c0_g4_i1:27-551(+)